MCIIITKERNSKLPTTQQFKNSWESNPHGAGIAWYDKKTRMTKWEKGLMTYEAFDNFLNHLKETIDVEKTAMVFHFRITSKGETCPEQCHPFPVSSKPNWKNVKRLNGESEVVFAHNGTMTSFKEETGYSDTQTFAINYLTYFYNSNPRFYEDQNLLRIIQNIIGSSKLAFIANNSIKLIGDFIITSDGLAFSNSSYASSYNYSYGYSSKDYLTSKINSKNPYAYVSLVTLTSICKTALRSKVANYHAFEELEDRVYDVASSKIFPKDKLDEAQSVVEELYTVFYSRYEDTKAEEEKGEKEDYYQCQDCGDYYEFKELKYSTSENILCCVTCYEENKYEEKDKLHEEKSKKVLEVTKEEHDNIIKTTITE